MKIFCEVQEELGKEKPSYSKICDLLKEKNKNFALVYLKAMDKKKTGELLDKIFTLKMKGTPLEQKASLGGLFFKVFKEAVKADDSKKEWVTTTLKKMNRKKKHSKEQRRKTRRMIQKSGLIDGINRMKLGSQEATSISKGAC